MNDTAAVTVSGNWIVTPAWGYPVRQSYPIDPKRRERQQRIRPLACAGCGAPLGILSVCSYCKRIA